jgi:hypothetical protein
MTDETPLIDDPFLIKLSHFGRDCDDDMTSCGDLCDSMSLIIPYMFQHNICWITSNLYLQQFHFFHNNNYYDRGIPDNISEWVFGILDHTHVDRLFETPFEYINVVVDTILKIKEWDLIFPYLKERFLDVKILYNNSYYQQKILGVNFITSSTARLVITNEQITRIIAVSHPLTVYQHGFDDPFPLETLNSQEVSERLKEGDWPKVKDLLL